MYHSITNIARFCSSLLINLFTSLGHRSRPNTSAKKDLILANHQKNNGFFII